MPTFGSLFSGIGGLDLGLERAGWECRWQVELDEWCRAVLARHWPGVPRFGAVESLRPDAGGDGLEGIEPGGTETRPVERVDLVCGGFPCQPVSVAGKRGGQADDRWLWPEYARVLRVLRPRFVVVENVPNLLAIDRGAAFAEVLGDLASLGYDTEWDCLPAAAFGAPHLRYRLFLVAHANEGELRLQPAGLAGSSGAAVATDDGGAGSVADATRDAEAGPAAESGTEWKRAGQGSEPITLADAEGLGGQVRPASGERLGRSAGGGNDVADAQVFTERPRLCACGAGGQRWGRSCDRCGSSDTWITEPNVGRVAHGVPARVDRLRALGNAVVPQVAEWIGRRLMEVA